MSATAETYARIFEGNPDGKAILEDLVQRFHARSPFVPGGIEGARQTDVNLGAMSVVQYILNKTHGYDPNVEDKVL